MKEKKLHFQNDIVRVALKLSVSPLISISKISHRFKNFSGAIFGNEFNIIMPS